MSCKVRSTENKSNRDVSEGATAEKQSVLFLKSQLFQVAALLYALVLNGSILPTCKNFYRQGTSKSNASAEMFCLEARGPCILISGKNQMNSICPGLNSSVRNANYCSSLVLLKTRWRRNQDVVFRG